MVPRCRSTIGGFVAALVPYASLVGRYAIHCAAKEMIGSGFNVEFPPDVCPVCRGPHLEFRPDDGFGYGILS